MMAVRCSEEVDSVPELRAHLRSQDIGSIGIASARVYATGWRPPHLSICSRMHPCIVDKGVTCFVTSKRRRRRRLQGGVWTVHAASYKRTYVNINIRSLRAARKEMA